MSPFKRLDVILSAGGLAAIILLGSIPILFEAGARYSGKWFPVVVNVMHDNKTPNDPEDDYPLPIVAAQYPSPGSEPPYVDVYVQFEKVRDCDFLIEEIEVNGKIVRVNRSLTWRDLDGRRLLIEFEPEDALLPDSRPTGPAVAGPWRIYGIRAVSNTEAVVVHRCHPLWLTRTQFHP